MALLEATLLMAMLSAIECQIVFPTRPIATEPVAKGCTASNGQAGTCFEFRSTQLRDCSYFPSLDTTNTNVAQHLRDNFCSNSGSAAFFCCPNNKNNNNNNPFAPPQQPRVPTVVTSGGNKECAMPCGNSPRGCSRPNVIPCEDECGRTNSDNVVGGEVAVRNAWPWLAAIGRKTGELFSPFCGGTLISKQHVITAAHCFSQRRNFVVTVRLGEYDTNEVSAIDGALDFTIMDKRVGDYNENTKENDIILLKLDRPLNAYTDSIRPACLPYHLREEIFEGQRPIVVGWGVFDLDNPRVSPVPLQTQVPVVPIPECQQRYRNGGGSGETVDNRQLCAGTGIQDSCSGDSGGPLNYIDTGRFRFYVIGLVSFGPRNCGSQNLPGVYLRIGHYLDWINQNIQQLL